MARHDYRYKSQEICVFVKLVGSGWIPHRVVVGSAHIGWPAGPYDVKKLATETEAAEYGHTVAR